MFLNFTVIFFVCLLFKTLFSQGYIHKADDMARMNIVQLVEWELTWEIEIHGGNLLLGPHYRQQILHDLT
jgi:hypothetical protein